MNKKSRFNHRWIGAILGTIGPLIGLVLVFVFYMITENFTLNRIWYMFRSSPDQISRFISLGAIFNFFIFYFFYKKYFNSSAMGVVLGTMIYVPIIIYLKFIA